MELSVKTLLSSGLLGSAHLERALRACAREGGSILRHLRQAADVSDEELCDLIARAADLPRCTPADLQAVDLEALLLLPRELCELTCAIPVRIDAWGNLVLAMADPFDEQARAEIEFAAARPVRVELATEAAVREAIARLYGSDGAVREPQFFADDDDLRELFAAAEVDERDLLEVVEVVDSGDGSDGGTHRPAYARA